MKNLIYTLIALFVLCSSAYAATYYVATNGNDSYTTTQAQNISTPWQTIQKAASTMVAGDIVNVRAGTYNESVTTQNSGTSGNYITYQRYASETVIITGGFTTSQSYIIVKGFEFSGSSITVNNSSSYCQILENYVHNSGVFGMFIGGSYVLVKNNRIANNGSSWGSQVTLCQWSAAAGHHIVFENNEVSDPTAQGEDFIQYFGHDIIVRYNYFHDMMDNGRHNDVFQPGNGDYNMWIISNTMANIHGTFLMGGGGGTEQTIGAMIWRKNEMWGNIGWGLNTASDHTTAA